MRSAIPSVDREVQLTEISITETNFKIETYLEIFISFCIRIFPTIRLLGYLLLARKFQSTGEAQAHLLNYLWEYYRLSA